MHVHFDGWDSIIGKQEVNQQLLAFAKKMEGSEMVLNITYIRVNYPKS